VIDIKVREMETEIESDFECELSTSEALPEPNGTGEPIPGSAGAGTEAKLTSKIVPRRMGVKARPKPVLLLLYEKLTGDVRKPRLRTMPLRKFDEKSDVQKFCFTMRHRHAEFLADVPSITMEKMMRVVQEILKGVHVGKQQ
jgi:hypothetical protein